MPLKRDLIEALSIARNRMSARQTILQIAWSNRRWL